VHININWMISKLICYEKRQIFFSCRIQKNYMAIKFLRKQYTTYSFSMCHTKWFPCKEYTLWRKKESNFTVERSDKPFLSQVIKSTRTMLSDVVVCILHIMQSKLHFTSVVLLPKDKTPVKSWKQNQINLNKSSKCLNNTP
jgi:hypothetical protein